MSDVRDDEALRRAFRELPAADDAGRCPPAETLAASAREELARGEERAVIDHLAGCGACAAAWAAVRDVSTEAGASMAADASTGIVVPASPRTRGLRKLAAVAAVLFAVAVGAGLWWVADRATGNGVAPGGGEPVRRAVSPEAPVPLSPLETLGPPWELRWSPGPEGTVYDVRITTPELDALHRALRRTEAVYRIPDEALERIRAEPTVVWQVVAHRPDGERHASRAVVVQVER